MNIFEILKSCSLCPRRCRVDRTKGERGYCQAPNYPVVYSYFPHKGEEPPISGKNGSGIVFFSHCPLRCVYCQNFKFSHLGEGRPTDVSALSGIFLELQELNCHNINLTTGTHFIPWIIKALERAKKKGLYIPVVWNTSGFEEPEVLKLLEGYIDIYLTDLRYIERDKALRYSSSPDYPEVAQKALKEMFRQVREGEFDSGGLMKKGVIIRILILPGSIDSIKRALRRLKQIIPQEKTFISILTQYYPFFKAVDYAEINRQLTLEEIEEVYDYLIEMGYENGWIQEERGLDKFRGVCFRETGVWKMRQ